MSDVSGQKKQERLVTWIQLPRRIGLLLLAFALALILVRALRGPLLASAPQPPGREIDWSVSLVARGQLVSDIIQEQRGSTLRLVGAAPVSYTHLTLPTILLV